MNKLINSYLTRSVFLCVAFFSYEGWAQQPKPWQIGFQEAHSPVMVESVWFHNSIMIPLIFGIVAFVFVLMIWCLIRYNWRRNEVSSNTTHNVFIEVVWTAVPFFILIFIAFPSFRILYTQETVPEEVDLTLKAVAAQFNWTYYYPDYGNFEIISNMKLEEDLLPGEPRLLATDFKAHVPAGGVVRVVTTSIDVIHSFALPAFGVKKDAVPGRLNETYFQAPEKLGTYYGQCSELCGASHAFMPIAIEVVSQESFDEWTKTQIESQGVSITQSS